MRTADDYLAKAVEFDSLAKIAQGAGLRKRYAELAESYRRVAEQRGRLIEQGPEWERNRLPEQTLAAASSLWRD